MPALSKKQQKFMGIVRSIQKGEQPASKFDKDARDAAKDMKKSSVKKFASTKHKGLPMKKEILGKLKELIKQELSEYTYGVGDVVKDVNPSCPHHGAMGKVKSVNPKSVVFVVMNKGNNFKPGQELEKSHDQMKKMKESVNEMSAKSKKIISKLGKKEKEMFMDMVDMMGFDQVMADYKKNPKAFKQALKDMSEGFASAAQRRAAFASGYKAKGKKKKKNEATINERNDEVQTGKDYTKLWLQSIGLVIKQANNLKGALGKHPIKRDLNKLKAVENLFKKFVKPAIEKVRANERHYAPNQTELKKYLSDSKFKVAVRILKQTIKSSNGYNENSWYNLDDKTNKLIEKMSKVLYDIETKLDNANLENINEKKKKMFPPDKMTPKQAKEYKRFIDYAKMGIEYKIDMSLFESINEDGHTDVASSKRKVMIMVDDSNKLLNKLNGMNKEDSLPSWWSDKITLSQNYLEKATNYLLNPVESVNEAITGSNRKELLKIGKEIKDNLFRINPGLKKASDDRLLIRGIANTFMFMRYTPDNANYKNYKKYFPKNFKSSSVQKLANILQNEPETVRKTFFKQVVKESINESIKEFRDKREADTALDQIGPKALYMIGAKDFIFGNSGGKKSLVFKIMRNSKGVSHIRMRLTSLDLYDLEFLAIRAGKIKVKSKEKGVYGDQLGVMIKKNTGLNVRL